MRLVRRLRGSTKVEIAPPRGLVTEDCTPSIIPLDNIKNAPYCKLFTANKKQVNLKLIFVLYYFLNHILGSKGSHQELWVPS